MGCVYVCSDTSTEVHMTKDSFFGGHVVDKEKEVELTTEIIIII